MSAKCEVCGRLESECLRWMTPAIKAAECYKLGYERMKALEEVARSFHDVAVKERDYERQRYADLSRAFTASSKDDAEAQEHLVAMGQRDQARIAELEKALEFYADPDTYFAIGFFPDAPCGEFSDDFSETEYGLKPGARARTTLKDKS